MNQNRDEAAELLAHYFPRAGVPVSSDAHEEIASIVDLIIAAAVDAIWAGKEKES